jgi:hypothetical protein
MSSLWTPSGEHRVPRAEPSQEAPDEARSERPGRGGSGPAPGGPGEPSEEEAAARLDQLQQEMAKAPVEAVVANHCYGLFELAALHLSQRPPQLDKARLAIDAMACLVQGLEGRLGPNEAALREGLAQIQMAFVQLQAAGRTGNGAEQGEG